MMVVSKETTTIISEFYLPAFTDIFPPLPITQPYPFSRPLTLGNKEMNYSNPHGCLSISKRVVRPQLLRQIVASHRRSVVSCERFLNVFCVGFRESPI